MRAAGSAVENPGFTNARIGEAYRPSQWNLLLP